MRGRLRILLLAGGLLAASGAVTALGVTRSDDGEGASAETAPAATAEAQSRDLTQVEEVVGTLDFGESQSLAAGRSGTLTSVASAGTVVERGEELYAIDRQPTALLFGDVPMYRDLAVGVDDGPDVRQLEENLRELGFTNDGDLIVDGNFDESTQEAVEAWQASRDLEETGLVALGDVVFLPHRQRVADAAADVGTAIQPGSPVMNLTTAARVVQLELEPSQADLAQVDDQVTVVLPDDREVEGTVAEVADAASSSAAAGDTGSGGESGGADGETVVEVTIELADQTEVESYTAASVDVELVRARQEDVLTVPVTALLALLEGGYAVEVPAANGTTELVSVEPGMFADGYVEVSGDGIDEGTEVVVPA